MLSNKLRNTAILMAMILLGSLLLIIPNGVEAGIFGASNEVTYKEYWVHHNQFTGGCNDDGSPTSPFGSWYLEPNTLAKCPKTVSFTLPDDFSNAAKIELYLDLWRNYVIQSATFTINDGSTIYRPPVGNDWGRTPYVLEIDKSEFKPGVNTIKFWGEKRYHVHDIGIRIYHTNDNPLLPGPGSDVEPPNGHLVSIADDNGPVAPDAGGTLTVNNNKLTLTADISADTAYVEFHAWYEGYDEDNDGVFRDWHNLGRNNWWPGGKEEVPTGGVINHIGTVKPKSGDTTATVVWNIPHVTNQPLIKFKIRVVDAAGNVREAAGGESADFKLMRAAPVNAFIIHDFIDTSLHMDGSRPDAVTYNFTMPNSVVTAFTQAYLVGAYWRNPNFSINLGGATSVSSPDWALGIKAFNKNSLVAGTNKITYLYTTGTGAFIERPGPMFVLGRANAVADNTAPTVSKQNPLPNATGVDVKVPIIAHVGDEVFGVDWTTVVMRVNGEDVTNKTDIRGTMGDYRLVYRQGNLAFDTEYNVEIEACDMVGNCMQTVSYKFNTAAPDSTPPVISDINVVPLPIGANISWTTNEPATSRIDYGKTQSYEFGFIEDLTLRTSHSVEIRGLQPDTEYQFRIKGTDEQNNTGQSGNQSFTTLEFGNLLSDDFNECFLDETVWQVIDPKGDVTSFMNGQQIELTIPAGVSHDFPSGNAPQAARLMQTAADEDFSVEVKFDASLTTTGQMQGILIEEDANTYVRISYEMSAAKGPIMFAGFVLDGVTVKGATREFALQVPPLTTPPAYMRVSRTGDEWSWFWSTNGVNWTRANLPYVMDMTVLNAGFFAGNSGGPGAQPAHKAVVDYFFNSALPIVPEDASPMNVNINQVGTGTVTRLPDKSPYTCGDEVILSATTIPGWSFSEWSGDATGNAPTTPVTIDAPKYITATFTQDQYLLNIVYENDGVGGAGNVVTRTPDQPTYVYGDVVELTAVAEPGWKFVEWGGAIVGTNPTVSVTMLKSETVTARFEQEQYDLDVSIVNNGIGAGGTVSVSPLKSTYVYGEMVTLTADLNPGWTFGGWSGGVTSAGLQTQLVITGDTAVTATFDQIQYEINVNVVGGGVVTLDPQKAFYLYGETVNIVAEGGACWSFGQWSGDLSGTNPVEIVTVTDDLDITATFAGVTYSLTVNEIGPGTVNIAPDQTEFECDEEVTLQAIPAANNYFAGWSGDLFGAQNPITFTIDKATVVTATFTDNPPPVVDPIADRTILVGELVTFEVQATDADGEPITLSAEGLPPGADFVDNGDGTGTFTWLPGVTQIGDHTVTFIASDGTGHGSAAVTITVEGTAIVLPMIIR